MKKLKTIIYLLVIMLFNTLIVSSYCYQETATASTACGGLSGGSYTTWGIWSSPERVYDGDYTLYGTTTIGNIGYLNITYLKPINSTNMSLWQNAWTNGITPNIANSTILQSCWDYNSTHILFIGIANYSGANVYTLWGCYNGSGINILRSSSPATTNVPLEEAMYWQNDTASPDTTYPNISSLSNTSTDFKRFTNVTYNFTATDETALSMIWVESNHTGTLANYSYVTNSGTSYIFSNNFNITLPYNSVINWRGCANDSSGNTNCSVYQSFTVPNTLPTIIQSSPIDRKVFNNGSVNILSFSATYLDLDGASGNCILWINTTAHGNNASVPNNTIVTFKNNVTLNNGNYLWFINCSDGTNLANSSERLFTIDNESIEFTWINPLSTNVTKTKSSSILVNISVVSNIFIDACLTRMFNTTSTIYNNLTINISASTFTALFTYILTGLPDGTYYIENSCNDTASFSPKIPYYTASKKTESIDFVDIPSGVNITLTIELHNPAGNPISMNGKNLILNATKDDAEEHILFGGTIDNLASPHTIKFIYSSNNNLPIKWIKASQFPAHIIVGNKFFHHKDLVTKGWNITQVGFEGNNFYLYFSKTSYNSTEDFDPITGEITVTTEVSSFVYDTTAPNISLNNPDNSANISTSIVDFNFTITDANTISNCSLYHNGTGTFALNKTLSSITNNTFTTISVSLLDGNYLWGIECTDEVGNINQSVNRTFLLDATSPKVNISIPANGAIVTIDSGSNVILNFYYNVTDINGIRNCTLYINNVVETSNTSVVKGVNSSFLNIIKSEGSYSWSVKCWDVFNNLQTSETFLFSVPSSDTIITTGGGGGGGGTVKEINESALLQSFLSVIAVCGNNKCDSGETLATCPKDCALLSSESFKGAIFAQFLLGFIIIVVVISLIVGAKKK